MDQCFFFADPDPKLLKRVSFAMWMALRSFSAERHCLKVDVYALSRRVGLIDFNPCVWVVDIMGFYFSKSLVISSRLFFCSSAY